MGTDAAYFVRRAKEELMAAERADCPEAAEAHREMARHHAAKAEELRRKVAGKGRGKGSRQSVTAV